MEIKILKASDVAKILRINKNQATKLMKQPDFPALANCGDLKVEESALFTYLQSRHDNNTESAITTMDTEEIEM